MKRGVIAALVGIIAIGGAFSAFATDRTVERVETAVELEVEVWVDVGLSSAFVSTRQEGEEWVTHDFVIPLERIPGVTSLVAGGPVSLSVPVTVEVELEAGEVVFTPVPAATPRVPPGEAPSGRGSCCTVRGMWDNRAAQRAISTELRKVISYAGTNLGLTHEGRITVNIAHQASGLLVRYRDAFGEAPESLPSECSFQRGTHLFFGPSCRGDEAAVAREWIDYAVQAHYLSARWVGVATSEYYWALYQTGEPPTVRDDRYRSAIFHQPATDFREGRAHEDMMAAVALFAIESYGTFEDWLAFYEEVREGGEVHTAFEGAFGVSLLQLYQDFEAWAPRQRANMLALAYGSCREAARYLPARSFQEGGGFPDYRVPLEFDADGDGYVCEGYGGFEAEELSCLVVGEVTAEEGSE